MESVLTIAGSDSGGGAGIQADLKAFSALGAFGISVVTAVTAQNTRGVQGVYDVSPEGVRNQLESVFSDFDIKASKTGMLFSRDIIEVVVEEVQKYHGKTDGNGKAGKVGKVDPGEFKLIVDPVSVSTSGDLLLQHDAIQVLVEKLFPISLLITPNLLEGQELAEMEIDSFAKMEKGAEVLIDKGANNVLLKGGHLKSEAESEKFAFDLLVTKDKKKVWFKEKRFDLGPLHGTGCTLSAAICALLGRDYELEEAIDAGKKYTHTAIWQGFFPGGGARVLNFFHDLS